MALIPILPGNERHKFIAAMRRDDRLGRGRWRKFMRKHGARGFASPMQLHALDAIAPSPVAVRR